MPRRAPLAVAFDLPFEEAIAAARARKVVLPEDYAKLPADKRAQAYTVGGLAALDQVQAVMDELTRQLQQGGTFGDFQRWARTAQLGLPPHTLETVYRNGIQQSYNAGHWRRFERDAEARPYLMYDAINDSRTRPAHRALDGVIRPVGDAFWGTHSPALGHRCRCRLVSLSREQAQARGGVTQNPPAEGVADAGWGRKPVDHARRLAELLKQKIEKTAPAIGRALQELIRETAPPRRYWDPETAAGRWHERAFASAPVRIKELIEAAGDPRALLTTPSRHPHCTWRQHIEMDGRDMNSPAGQSTWRHEFGHHVDGMLAKGGLYLSERPEFVAAMRADAASLIEAGGAGRASRAQAARVQELAKAYTVATAEMLGAADRRAWLSGRFAGIGIDLETAEESLRLHTDFATVLAGVGRDVRYARIAVALEQRDAQGLMDALAGAPGEERMAAYKKGCLGSLSDLIGSATKNKLGGTRSGFGHADSYYAKQSNLQGTECFANLFCLYGEGGLLWKRTVETLFPKLVEVFLTPI